MVGANLSRAIAKNDMHAHQSGKLQNYKMRIVRVISQIVVCKAAERDPAKRTFQAYFAQFFHALMSPCSIIQAITTCIYCSH
jgi:hypothetical protein